MKRIIAFLGIIIGLTVAVMGLLVLCGNFTKVDFPDYPRSPALAQHSETSKSGYATFGADFYTYVSNNAYEAAKYAKDTAETVYEAAITTYDAAKNSYYTAANLFWIADFLKTVFGILLMGIGLISATAFGMAMPNAAPKAADAVTEEPANGDAIAAADETPAAEPGETDGETAAPVSPAESADPAAPSV